MLAVFFEILAVVFGTKGLVVPKILYPEIKFTDSIISQFATLKKCGIIYRALMALCFIFNSVALYFYIGPIGLLILVGLVALIIDYGSKIHLTTILFTLTLYGFSSVIYNPWFGLNYLPVLGLIYAIISFRKNKSDSVGIVFLVYSSAALMLINILVVGKT